MHKISTLNEIWQDFELKKHCQAEHLNGLSPASWATTSFYIHLAEFLVQRQPRETSGPWDDWSRNKKHEDPAINILLWTCCHWQNLGFFGHGSVYTTPGLLVTGTPVSQREKDLCTGVSKVHWKSFKLDFEGERDKIKLSRDKPQGSMPKFEGRCASEAL